MLKTLAPLVLALALGLALPATELAPQRSVNLNTATVTELLQPPRVWAKTAERIAAFLATAGVRWTLRFPALDIAQSEVRGALHEARALARHRGRAVTVALQSPDLPQDVLALRLPRQVQWGKPDGVPLADHVILGDGRFHSFRAAEGWDRE